MKLFKKAKKTFYKVYFRKVWNGELCMEKLDRVGYNNFMMSAWDYEILGVTKC